VTGTASAASENEIWVVASEDYSNSLDVATKMEEYVEDIFYDSNWNIYYDYDYDMSGAPKDDDGTYTKSCGGGEYSLWNWWGENASYADDPDDCQLLTVPKDMYGGGCGGANSAVSTASSDLPKLASPDSGDKTKLIGDRDNDRYAFNEPARSVARCLQEMGHTWKAAHADGHIHVNNSVNRHTPMMLGDGQENNCGYDVNHCGWCDDRFVEGYTDCAGKNMPHQVLDYSESTLEDI